MFQNDGLRCNLCAKIFFGRNRRQDFKRHVLSHTGERPYACNICDYKAALKGNLKKHMLIHEKQSLSQINPKEYAQLFNLFPDKL